MARPAPAGPQVRPGDRLAPVELEEAVRRRRMVRRFRPEPQVDEETVRHLLDLASRAPSAGFSQGWDFVVLRRQTERAAFWRAAAPEDAGVAPDSTRDGSATTGGDAWLRGVSAAPTLLVCLSDPGAYLDRYAEPDKGWGRPGRDPDAPDPTDASDATDATDRSDTTGVPHPDPGRWPVPYWDTDTAMAVMNLLLGATEAGLGALFFGVPGPAHPRVRAALGVPAGRRILGVVALGEEAERVRSPSLRRGRRGVDDIAHWGRYGASPASREPTSARMDRT